MKQLFFNGITDDLMDGITELKGQYGFSINSNGYKVNIKKTDENMLTLKMNQQYADIVYNKKIQFYRALGHLLQNWGSDNFSIKETPVFKTNGLMFDVSRNAVINMKSIKKALRIMSIMGLDTIMLYTEDIYTVDSEPYFGYMRGRYSKKEIIEIDDYAYMLGIEVIPCIQTLAHLEQFIKWNSGRRYKDTGNSLIAGEDHVYDFIERMIESSSAPLRSNRIHIGMDEAWNLGRGKYLDKNGYEDPYNIIQKHLDRVLDIVRTKNLKAMMWSDMYFRAGSKTGDYYDLDVEFSPSLVKSVPSDVQFVYWDYYHNEKDFYETFIEKHKELSANIVFAGGIWIWKVFGVNYNYALNNTNAALTVCRSKGIKEVFATMWMDDGGESNWFYAMIGWQAYAEHSYKQDFDCFDKNQEKYFIDRFEACTGVSYKAVFDLKLMDENEEGLGTKKASDKNPSKAFLWQDILIGLCDYYIKDTDLFSYYSELACLYEKYESENPEWSDLFTVPKHISKVLSLKADAGIKLKAFYDNKDIEGLKHMKNNVLPEILKRVEILRKIHRDNWLKYKKPFGWEVLDIRYGGVAARTETAISRINDYINGKITRIEELEEERLSLTGKKDVSIKDLLVNYKKIATASSIL